MIEPFEAVFKPPPTNSGFSSPPLPQNNLISIRVIYFLSKDFSYHFYLFLLQYFRQVPFCRVPILYCV